MMQRWTHHQTLLNDRRFHYVEQGEGPLSLLLHGFPDFWYSWRYQIPALADAGFRVIAPDLRGYNLSEKPSGVEAYHLNHLVDDVVAMLREWGGEHAFLIGHDWGGVIAWHVASRHPDLIEKLIILNAPHPNRFLEVLRKNPHQWRRSSYIAFFQLPWLPERLLRMRDGKAVEAMVRSAGVDPMYFTPEDAMRYRMAITQPGASAALLNYYRSMARRVLGKHLQEPPTHIAVPTLLLWGMHDVALVNDNATYDDLLRWVPTLHVEPLEASHWPHMDLPDVVNQRMIEFLTGTYE